MQLYRFNHNPPVKAGCCNYRTSNTYWMADSREQAEKEIENITDSDREPHGNCAQCLADLLAEKNHEITRLEAEIE